MSAPTYNDFMSQLRMFLRDQPKGTTAELTDFAIAYWNGHHVVGLYLREDDLETLDEDFELDDNAWENWREELTAWLASPQFRRREELCGWLADAPPFDIGEPLVPKRTK